jgi:hypothetical protein
MWEQTFDSAAHSHRLGSPYSGVVPGPAWWRVLGVTVGGKWRASRSATWRRCDLRRVPRPRTDSSSVRRRLAGAPCCPLPRRAAGSFEFSPSGRVGRQEPPARPPHWPVRRAEARRCSLSQGPHQPPPSTPGAARPSARLTPGGRGQDGEAECLLGPERLAARPARSGAPGRPSRSVRSQRSG